MTFHKGLGQITNDTHHDKRPAIAEPVHAMRFFSDDIAPCQRINRNNSQANAATPSQVLLGLISGESLLLSQCAPGKISCAIGNPDGSHETQQEQRVNGPTGTGLRQVGNSSSQPI